MASGVKITLNSATIQKMLDGGEGVSELLHEKAEAVLSAAKADAANYRVTGAYLDRLEVSEDHTDRMALRVGSSAPHSHLVEAKHGTLARALDAAGGA